MPCREEPKARIHRRQVPQVTQSHSPIIPPNEKGSVVAEKAFRKASAEVYGNTSQDKAQIEATPTKYIMGVAYGEGSPVHSVTQLVQMAAGHTPSLVPAPSFLTAQGKAYGPLFLGIHGHASNKEDLEKIERLSSLLPEWFYIYNPGLAQVAPATVLNNSKHLPFVEPK